MVNGDKVLTWEEESLARLSSYKTELNQIEEKRKILDDQCTRLIQLIESLEKVVELTRQRDVVSIDSHSMSAENLRRKSIRSSLIDMAKHNNGLVIAVDAVRLLMKAGVYTDKTQARGTVYPTLSKDKSRKGEHFIKVRPGVYRLLSGKEIAIPMQV